MQVYAVSLSLEDPQHAPIFPRMYSDLGAELSQQVKHAQVSFMCDCNHESG